MICLIIFLFAAHAHIILLLGRYWLNTLGFERSFAWDFSAYTPDAVIVLLGPNDPSTNKPERFITAYIDMLELVARSYSGARSVHFHVF